MCVDIMRRVRYSDGWQKKLYKGDKLEFLAYGVDRDITRIEFKKSCVTEGLDWIARGSVGREHDHFRVTLTKGDSKICQSVDTEKLSKYVRKVGWRVCIANMIESEKEVRRQERVKRAVNSGGEGGCKVSKKIEKTRRQAGVRCRRSPIGTKTSCE